MVIRYIMMGFIAFGAVFWVGVWVGFILPFDGGLAIGPCTITYVPGSYLPGRNY